MTVVERDELPKLIQEFFSLHSQVCSESIKVYEHELQRHVLGFVVVNKYFNSFFFFKKKRNSLFY